MFLGIKCSFIRLWRTCDRTTENLSNMNGNKSGNFGATFATSPDKLKAHIVHRRRSETKPHNKMETEGETPMERNGVWLLFLHGFFIFSVFPFDVQKWDLVINIFFWCVYKKLTHILLILPELCQYDMIFS